MAEVITEAYSGGPAFGWGLADMGTVHYSHIQFWTDPTRDLHGNYLYGLSPTSWWDTTAVSMAWPPHTAKNPVVYPGALTSSTPMPSSTPGTASAFSTYWLGNG